MKRRWGDFWVFTGGVVIAATLYAGLPYVGVGVLGLWRIAGITLGLLAIGAGLVVGLRHSVLSTTLKTGVVAIILTAVGAFAFFGVEYLPANLPDCATVARPTPENRRPVYCETGNGTLVRMSITRVGICPDGGFEYARTVETPNSNWRGSGWEVSGTDSPCRL